MTPHSTLPRVPTDLEDRLHQVFGEPTDPMPLLESRARALLPGLDVIVWEGDATNFQFLFVSKSAEAVLGYPGQRWLDEPTFWADTVVHPEDRDYAVSYCALATGQGRDHEFEYRAVAADGTVRHLYDVVRVNKGKRGVATHLRGVMIDLTDNTPQA